MTDSEVQRAVTSESAIRYDAARETLYERDLPGGGKVRIELVDETPADAMPPRCRARVAVERRDAEDRQRGNPPVIAELERPSREEVLGELYRVALDNVAIARGLLGVTRVRRTSGATIVARGDAAASGTTDSPPS